MMKSAIKLDLAFLITWREGE